MTRFNSRFNGRFEGRNNAGHGGGGGLSRIIDIPDLQAWYDSSDSAYLTLSSTAITQMLDRSGNGNHTAVQSTGTERPTLTAAALNGKSVASFDGGDYLLCPAALLTITAGSNTAFVVGKRDTEAGSNNNFIAGDSTPPGSTAPYLVQLSSTAGSIIFKSRDTIGNGVTSTGNTNTTYQIVQCSREGTTQSIAINGGAATTNASGVDYALMSTLSIGRYAAGTPDALTGGIAEILIYNRALSTAEILQVELYLANKWGIYHPDAAWISTYSPFWQMLIHAWKINKDDVGTNTTGNPFAAIYDPSVAALGSTTSLTDVGRNVNTATEATNPPVNTSGAIGSANGLLYNGTTTTLNAGSNTSVDNIFAAGGCFIGVVNPTTAGESASATDGGRVFDKSYVLLRVSDAFGSTCRLKVAQSFSVTAGIWQNTNRDVTLGAANIIGMTYNSAADTNAPSIYVNSITAKAVTTSTAASGVATSDAADNLILGNNSGAARTFNGYIGKYVFLKSVPTTAQLTSVFNFLATEYGVTLT